MRRYQDEEEHKQISKRIEELYQTDELTGDFKLNVAAWFAQNLLNAYEKDYLIDEVFPRFLDPEGSGTNVTLGEFAQERDNFEVDYKQPDAPTWVFALEDFVITWIVYRIPEIVHFLIEEGSGNSLGKYVNAEMPPESHIKIAGDNAEEIKEAILDRGLFDSSFFETIQSACIEKAHSFLTTELWGIAEDEAAKLEHTESEKTEYRHREEEGRDAEVEVGKRVFTKLQEIAPEVVQDRVMNPARYFLELLPALKLLEGEGFTNRDIHSLGNFLIFKGGGFDLLDKFTFEGAAAQLEHYHKNAAERWFDRGDYWEVIRLRPKKIVPESTQEAQAAEGVWFKIGRKKKKKNNNSDPLTVVAARFGKTVFKLSEAVALMNLSRVFLPAVGRFPVKTSKPERFYCCGEWLILFRRFRNPANFQFDPAQYDDKGPHGFQLKVQQSKRKQKKAKLQGSMTETKADVRLVNAMIKTIEGLPGNKMITVAMNGAPERTMSFDVSEDGFWGIDRDVSKSEEVKAFFSARLERALELGGALVFRQSLKIGPIVKDLQGENMQMPINNLYMFALGEGMIVGLSAAEAEEVHGTDLETGERIELEPYVRFQDTSGWGSTQQK